MKRRILVSLAAVAAVAVPAQASAATVTLAHLTAVVKKGYNQQIRTRTKLAGFKFIDTTVKCAAVAHNQWTCYGTYTIKVKHTYARYGQFINVTPDGWKAQGSGTLLKQW